MFTISITFTTNIWLMKAIRRKVDLYTKIFGTMTLLKEIMLDTQK